MISIILILLMLMVIIFTVHRGVKESNYDD